jgi:hypothetical protein
MAGPLGGSRRHCLLREMVQPVTLVRARASPITIAMIGGLPVSEVCTECSFVAWNYHRKISTCFQKKASRMHPAGARAYVRLTKNVSSLPLPFTSTLPRGSSAKEPTRWRAVSWDTWIRSGRE